jgi:ABC-2 type transport system permease protein
MTSKNSSYSKKNTNGGADGIGYPNGNADGIERTNGNANGKELGNKGADGQGRGNGIMKNLHAGSYLGIFRFDFRRRIWLLAVSVLASILFVVVPYLVVQSQFYAHISSYDAIIGDNRQSYFIEYLNTVYISIIGFVAMFMAVLGGVSGFHYLHSRRESDMYHSLPVKRSRFFWVIYGNGLMIWLIPLLISSLLVTVLVLSFIGSFSMALVLAAGRGILIALLLFLIVYHFCLVCVMFSGNVLNTFFSLIVFGVGIAACYGLLELLFSEYLYSFIAFSFSSDIIVWASPLVSAISLLVMFTSDVAGESHLWGLYLGSALLMAVNLVLAHRLYVTRASELAGGGIENKWVQRLLRVLTTVVCGLSGGLFFHMLLSGYGFDRLGFTIFGCILGAVLSFGVADMIFAMSFRAFLRHKVQMAVCCAGTLAVYLCIVGGWFGYNHWVPDQDDIDSATFYFSNYTDRSNYYYINSNGKLVRSPSDTEVSDGKAIYQPARDASVNNFNYGNMNFKDAEAIRQAMVTLTENALSDSMMYSPSYVYPIPPEVDTYPFTIRAKITLDSGINVYRSYNLREMDYDTLWPIVDSPEYRYHFFRLSEGQVLAPKLVEVTDLAGVDYQMENQADIQALIEAYRADFDQHYTPDELYTGVSIGELSYQFETNSNSDGSVMNYTSYSLTLYDSYDNTLALLRSVLPEAKFTWKELGLQAIDLSFYNVLNGQSLDTVCSWYGLNGYDEMKQTIGDVFGAWSEQVISNSELGNAIPEYRLLVTDPKELEELSQFIYTGNVRYGEGRPLAYLVVGYGYLDAETPLKLREEEAAELAKMAEIADEKAVTYYAEPTRQNGMRLYVKVGELPKEWIERIVGGG